jgi:hypothetical protein
LNYKSERIKFLQIPNRALIVGASKETNYNNNNFQKLKIKKMKNSILLSVIVLLIASVFISCEKEEEKVEFKVVSIVPVDNATGVSIDANVVITFSKPVLFAYVLLGPGATSITTKKTFSEDKRVLTIDPMDVLLKNTRYGTALMKVISEDGDTLKMIMGDVASMNLMQYDFTTEN